MSWIRNVRHAFQGLATLGQAASTLEKAGVPTTNLITAWFTGRPVDPGVTVSKPYAQHPTTYRGVNVIARQTARIPIEVRPEGAARTDAIPNHWLPRLLKTPGQGRNGSQLIQAVQISLKLRGEAFLWHRNPGRGAEGRDGIRRPQALWMLHPLNMEPSKTRDDNGPVSWLWTSPQGSLNIPSEELTFIRYENPHDEDRGLGPIQAALLEIEGDHLASRWSASFYHNQAIPPIVFVPKAGKTWQPPDQERFLESWNAKLQGAHRRGIAGALPQDIDVKELKFTQQEAQHLEERQFRGARVLSVLGVPPFLAGDLQHASWANSTQQNKTFWLDTMVPDAADLSAALTSDLLNRYEQGLEVVLNVKPVLAEVLAEDTQMKVETAVKLWGMGFTAEQVNERLELGLEVGPGDEHLRTGFLPVSVVPAELALEPPEPEPVIIPGQEDEDEDEDEPEDEGPEEDEDEERDAAGTRRKDARERERTLLYSGLARRWGSRSRAFHRAMRSWLWKLRTETLENLTAAAQKAKTKAEDPLDVDPLDVLFDQDRATGSLERFSIPMLTAAMMAGGQEEVASFGVEFDHLQPEARAAMASKTVKLREKVPAIREAVRLAVIEGMEAGDSVIGTGKRIREVFNIQRTRALTIARTEMAQAFSTGRFFGIKQTARRGERIEWISSRDKRVRLSHLELDGKSVTVGNRFANGCRYPSDPTGPADQVINCRCQPRRARR